MVWVHCRTYLWYKLKALLSWCVCHVLLLCRGVIVLGNETFGLQPVPHSDTNEHLLYLLKDVQSEPVTCGVVDEAASSTHSHEDFEPGQSLTSLLRVRGIDIHPWELFFRVSVGYKIKRGWRSKWFLFLLYCFLFEQRKRNLPQTSYVELVLVVDNLRVSVFISL